MTQSNHIDSILIVTSAPQSWTSVNNALQAQGYHVEIAEGAVVALSMIDHRNPDLLVIDSALKDLDLDEVIQIIRNEYSKSTLPILLAIQSEYRDLKEKANYPDANDVFQKPIDIERLKNSLRILLQTKHVLPNPDGKYSASASPQLEKLKYVNRRLKQELQQSKRLERKLQRQIKKLEAIGANSQQDSIVSRIIDHEVTGLLSLPVFEHKLTDAISNAKKTGSEHTLCYIQASNLSQFEFCYGELAKDGILRQYARIIQLSVREYDSLAHIGNGEFWILMEHCSIDQAERMVDILREKTKYYRFIFKDKELSVDFFSDLVPIRGENAESIMINTAVKVAAHKSGGQSTVIEDRSNNIVSLEVNKGNPSQIVTRIGSTEYLLDAMSNGRFQLYFQPIESLHKDHNSEGARFELFLRLQDKYGRFVRPAAFLPAAEQFEVIAKLDRWTISTALTWLAKHMTRFRRLALCSINLSGRTLSDETLHEYTKSKFTETGVPAHKICFEINQTKSIEDVRAARHFMSLLGELGCAFALDDFGSSLSSLAHMKNLPAEYIKIDGKFIKDITVNSSHFSTVRSINEIAHALGKKTIAEFVEDDDTLDKLKEIGVNYAQGYAIGRPLPIKGLLVQLLATPVRW
jgi:EAL domain-containing protein (putative c-di-GMP-specific phosphodiesterase class I)/PleD family two-component response regulator